MRITHRTYFSSSNDLHKIWMMLLQIWLVEYSRCFLRLFRDIFRTYRIMGNWLDWWKRMFHEILMRKYFWKYEYLKKEVHRCRFRCRFVTDNLLMWNMHMLKHAHGVTNVTVPLFKKSLPLYTVHICKCNIS